MRTKIRIFFSLSIFFLSLAINAQVKNIKGKVIDANGSPISMVLIEEKNTGKSTTADLDGNFEIEVSEGSTLIIDDGAGGKKEVVVGKNSKITVQFSNISQSQISEVVVNSLGLKTDKNKVASSYSNVSGQEAVNSGEKSILQGLSGKASGVQIVSNSGDPGAGAYFQIRGQNTITGNSQPLIVIDGIPVSNESFSTDVQGLITTNQLDGVSQQNRLIDINPNDVADIQVLKGASASALWGYRAANGVVLITTKKGKGKGKLSVDFTSTYSFDRINRKYNTQNIWGQGLDGKWNDSDPRYNNSSWGDKISFRSGAADELDTSGIRFVSDNGNTYYPIVSKNSRETFDNYGTIIGNGSSFENYLALSGASDKADYYFSMGRLDQKGIIRNSDYNRTTFNFKTTVKIDDRASVTGRFSYTNSNSNRVQSGSNTSGLMLGLLRTPTDFDQRDYIGTKYLEDGTPIFGSHRSYRNPTGTGSLENELRGTPGYNNPIWTTDVQKNPNTVNRFIGGLETKYKATKWLDLLARVGFDTYQDKRITMFPVRSSENNGNGSASESFIGANQYNVDIMGLGNTDLTTDLNVNYLLGVNFFENQVDVRGGNYINFIEYSSIFTYENALAQNTNSIIANNIVRNTGLYTTNTFDFKKYLFLTLGGRLEASSTTGKNNYRFYPTAEFGYKFNEQLKWKALSNAKFRATYGEVAINPLSYYTSTYFDKASGTEGYGPGYDAGSYSGSFMRSTLQGNENLKPEIKKEFEIGLDVEILRKINLSATFYSNKIKDNLIEAQIPGTTGSSRIYGNFADIKNQGFEIEFSADLIKNKNFKWEVFGNWSTYRNEVTHLEKTNSVLLNGFAGASSRAVLGQAVGVLWGGKWQRDENNNLILDENQFPKVAAEEGIIGNPNPDWMGSLGTAFNYKGFRLSGLFAASIGGDVWDGTTGALHHFGTSNESANEVFLTPEQANTITNVNGKLIKDLSYFNSETNSIRGNLHDFGGGTVLLDQAWYRGNGGGFGPVAEQFVKSASWLKLREVAFSYRLNNNNNVFGNSGINYIELGITGRNFLLWTEDNIGIDPESNLTGSSNGRGLQYFNHPGTQSFIFTFKMGF